ncbi:GspH/FimT family pseudopilin [Rhodoferax sp.]|uniref:GspH/FimT family pseudopilin n=1 Tax=Rhodoferax sp. TaxID=50421 RepID=UPI0027319253|nr:GspH/FimT family pseudopilin [Rhodoferax sp.]MDP1528868.1 GspH/FimT family pseudopilin [Rhodoferax sp.]MDP1943554.1 GspH/FimT family pseudopilin [Rhodoferax sp.]MDP2442059.1 GspH/FimT family pseudopilin [Rhodoferax sp.]MDZ4206131.1 GspH/FimT family pseudopilin [Rhodoferax sp.]
MKKRFASAGFTLIELMVVVALAALLQSLALPAFRGFVNSMRLTVAVNSLFTSLLLARSEAIKRNGRAVVCKTVTGETCVTTGGWQQGWIVFHDANNNARRDAGEVIVSHQQATAASILLNGNAPLVSYVSYTPMGQTAYASGAFQAGTLTVCVASSDSQEARQIVISSAGRPRTVRTTVAKCPL